MKERNKIRQFIQGLRQIIVQNPVEACLACIFSYYGVVWKITEASSSKPY